MGVLSRVLRRRPAPVPLDRSEQAHGVAAPPTAAATRAPGAQAPSSIEHSMGEYHNLVPGSDTEGHFTETTTTFVIPSWPHGDRFVESDYATAWGEPESESRSEVVAYLTTFRDLDVGGTVNHTWTAPNGFVMLDFDFDIPPPGDEFNGVYSWYQVYSFIGRFRAELNIRGDGFLAEMTSPWGSTSQDFVCSGPQLTGAGLSTTEIEADEQLTVTADYVSDRDEVVDFHWWVLMDSEPNAFMAVREDLAIQQFENGSVSTTLVPEDVQSLPTDYPWTRTPYSFLTFSSVDQPIRLSPARPQTPARPMAKPQAWYLPDLTVYPPFDPALVTIVDGSGAMSPNPVDEDDAVTFSVDVRNDNYSDAIFDFAVFDSTGFTWSIERDLTVADRSTRSGVQTSAVPVDLGKPPADYSMTGEASNIAEGALQVASEAARRDVAMAVANVRPVFEA